jgi:acyl-CoA thioesterase
MSSCFASTMKLENGPDGLWLAEVDESWGQGRALFGGIQAALVVQACETQLGAEERQLRTLAMSFCRAAQPGRLEVEARLERAGRYISHLSARLSQDGEVVATALATFARDRNDPLVFEERLALDLPEPEALSRPRSHPFLPTFLQHFDIRFVPGFSPYAGGQVAEAKGWLRFAEPITIDGKALAALLDVWPPAVLTTLAPPRSSASVDLRYDIVTPMPIVDAGPEDFLAFDCRVLDWRAGQGIDEGELRTRDGRLIARIRQLRAIF